MVRRIVVETAETPAQTFETTSKDLVIGLLTLGHQPYRVESEGRIIFYKFNRADVAKDVTRLLTGEDLQVSFHRSIVAHSVWAMNLTRANELNLA